MLDHSWRRHLIVGITLLLAAVVPAQDAQWTNGVYLDLKQLQLNVPTAAPGLCASKRAIGDIQLNGGNDYRLGSVGDPISKKYLKREVYAFASNDSLFLNGAQFKLQKWYALALTHGPFIVFRGCMTNNEAMGHGLMGGAIASTIVATKRYPYVLSLRTGNVRPLTKEYVVARLKEADPDLLAQYMGESDQESERILTDHIDRLNKFLNTAKP